MKLMYIDESGDTIPLTNFGKKFFVLTGCIIDENDLLSIEGSFRQIKTDFYQNPDIEIKSNFLRYANPDLSENSPLKLKSRAKYDELEKRVSDLLKQIPTILYSIVIHKKDFWDMYPAQNPYDTAYMFLLERFQMYLQQEKAHGICIIDPREGQIEKHFFGNELNDLHNRMRWENNNVWIKCPRVIEKLLFSQSDKTVGIQIADLYCYPVFHIFEYNKKGTEYWRFYEFTQPKLYSKEGIIDGVGLKFFPDKTKKSLRFYS